jgi:uncharacterized protein YwqG
MTRMPTRDEAVDLIRRSSLAEFADAIIAELAPSALLQRDPTAGDVPLGVSRFGGEPDLPAHFAWPTREIVETKGILRRHTLRRPGGLDFLAQIRCEELAGLALPDGVPRRGMLWVFYDAEEQPWGFRKEDAAAARIVHVADPGPLSRTQAPPRRRHAFRPCRIRPVESWTLPEQTIPIDSDDEALVEAYLEELCVALHGDPTSPLHRLLGHGQWIQNDATEDEPGSRLLLQIDSDDDVDGPGWMWGDAGRLYFTLMDEQLRAQRFDAAQWGLQCY